eukprot:11550431-Alexandrium_andersonii.AAC.1
MLYVWSMRTWSASRWLSIGRASRSCVLCLLLGVSDLVSYILAAGESRYYIGGLIDHMRGQVIQLLVLAASASRVPDAILDVVMADDRIPRVLDEIDNEVHLEMQYIMHMPFSCGRC